MKSGRNDPCTCGSGQKYKKCCGGVPTDSRTGRSETAIRELAGLLESGRHADVERHARTLLDRYPQSGLIWKVLGHVLFAQGKEALDSLARAAELLPEDAEAHSNLGNALRMLGQPERALQCYERSLAVMPNYAEAFNNRGSALQDLGSMAEALASFTRAIELKPNFALAHCNLGGALTLQNRPDEAEASIRRALAIKPDLTASLVQLADLQANRGLFAEADALLRRAIAIDPDMPEAWSGLVRWRKMKSDDHEWLRQAQRIVGSPQPPQRELHLQYALGKYFDDVREYEEAFIHYQRANELSKRFIHEYNRETMTTMIESTARQYDRRWIDRASVDGLPSGRPVFIVGMWRSGTSLAEQILASHNAAYGAGELSFWKHASAAMRNREMRNSAGNYLALLERLSPGALRVIDKMSANFLHLGLIHAMLPGARIIHMRRNPMDTCLSIYFQHFRNSETFSTDLGDIAHYYEQYLRLMRHWRRVIPDHALFEVRYEDLVQNAETVTRKMLEFLELPWDANCNEFGSTPRTVSTLSKWQVRQPINQASVERWRHYEKFVTPLRPLLELASET